GLVQVKNLLKFRSLNRPFLKHQNSHPVILKIVALNRDSIEKPCLIDINNVEIDQVQLVQFDEKDSVVYLSKKLGDIYPFSERIIPHRVLAIPVKLKPRAINTFYIALYNKNRVITCFLDFDSEKFWRNKTQRANFTNGIITGLFSCFIFIGLILFTILKRKVYLFYSLYSLSICLLLLTMKGYSFEYIFPNSTWIQARFLLVVQLFGLMCLNLYAIEFLQLEKKFSYLSKATLPIIILFLLMIGLVLLEVGRKFDIENYLSIILYGIEGVNFFVVLMLGPLIYFKHKLKSALIFGISFSFVGISLLYSTLSFVIPNLPYVLLMDSLSVTLFMEISILTVFMVFNYRKEINEKLKLQETLLEKSKENQNAFLEGQEAEKKIIAQELHDGVATDLLVVQRLIEKESTLKNHSINKILSNISLQMRQISHSMFPDALIELGLAEGLKSLFRPWEDKISINIYFSEKNYNISKSLEIQIYRIVQELLKNTLKHSDAKNIYFQLIRHAEEIVLEFEDDGIGFEFSKYRQGMGLKSIIYRAESINADINFESAEGKGMLFQMKIKSEIK
ncbi:MAG: 7TM diverse intracellular signaling domain-containing protein, partial [Bacteroidota bacterium]